MKLSSDTIEILKNFSSINQSILFKEGNTLHTISPLRTVLASAEIVESIPSEFAIYDLNKMLAKINLYGGENCTLKFEEDRVVFVNGTGSGFSKHCSPKVIVTPPDKKLSISNPDYSFQLSEKILSDHRKKASVSGSPNFVFESDGEQVQFVSTDVKDDSSDRDWTPLCEGDGRKFSIVMKVENFRMIDGDYDVEISQRGLAKFTHTTKNIQYFIAIEAAQSKFE